MPDLNAIEDFLGEEVVDREGDVVGTFACYWERRTRKALLLGVEVRARPGHTHIVPAQGARFNERQTYVVVAFTKKTILEAPCLDCSSEIDEALEHRVWAFYELLAEGGGRPRPEHQAKLRRITGRAMSVENQSRSADRTPPSDIARAKPAGENEEPA
jgi:hypothetical protein